MARTHEDSSSCDNVIGVEDERPRATHRGRDEGPGVKASAEHAKPRTTIENLIFRRWLQLVIRAVQMSGSLRFNGKGYTEMRIKAASDQLVAVAIPMFNFVSSFLQNFKLVVENCTRVLFCAKT